MDQTALASTIEVNRRAGGLDLCCGTRSGCCGLHIKERSGNDVLYAGGRNWLRVDFCSVFVYPILAVDGRSCPRREPPRRALIAQFATQGCLDYIAHRKCAITTRASALFKLPERPLSLSFYPCSALLA